MTQKRRRCDKQFKIAAARVVLGGEMRAVDLARELGVKDPTLRRWAQEHGGRARAPSPETAARRSTRITRSRSSASMAAKKARRWVRLTAARLPSSSREPASTRCKSGPTDGGR